MSPIDFGELGDLPESDVGPERSHRDPKPQNGNAEPGRSRMRSPHVVDLVAGALAGAGATDEGRSRAAAAAALATDPDALRAARALVADAERVLTAKGADARPPGRPLSDFVDEIVAFAARPRLSWGFPELDKVAPWPTQCVCSLIGPSGFGKTSLSLQVAQHHQRTLGPVLFLSKELAGVLAGARVVSQNHHAASWLEVLDGKVAKADIAIALSGLDMVLMDEVSTAWVAHVRLWLAHWKKTRPKATPLVVADYLQIMPCETARDDGERVKYGMAALSDLVKEFDCGALAISKPSRAGSRALRSGESFGADTAESGAESNAIEFYSTAQIALGVKGDEDEAGWARVEVSVGKARYRGGDHVVPMDYHGRHGLFRQAGEARTSAEVRREREGDKSERKVKGKHDAVYSLIGLGQGRDFTFREILESVGGRKADLHATLTKMVSGGELEEEGNGYTKAYRLNPNKKGA